MYQYQNLKSECYYSSNKHQKDNIGKNFTPNKSDILDKFIATHYLTDTEEIDHFNRIIFRKGINNKTSKKYLVPDSFPGRLYQSFKELIISMLHKALQKSRGRENT